MPFVGMEQSAAKKERDVATKSNPAFKQLRSCNKIWLSSVFKQPLGGNKSD